MNKSLAQKLGIIEKIKEIKQEGGKLSDFRKFNVIKTEGSSNELHEWVDAFVQPLDKEKLENYYKNPELFLEYGRKNMNLFLKLCEVLNKYATAVLDERLSIEERDTALLMAMHLTFSASDMIYKHDRFLEVLSPEISPLGKIYNEIHKIVKKVAELKGYNEKWKNETLSLLISMPEYLSIRLRLLLACLTIFKKYPFLSKIKEKEEILKIVKENPEVEKEIKEMANKYLIDVESFMNILLIVNPEMLENIKESIKRKSNIVKRTFNELKTVLSSDEYDALIENYKKLRYFKELQEFTSLIIRKPNSMEAIGKMINAMDYFKNNITRFVKKEYIEEIKETLELIEKGLPLGDFYFVPRLRKLIYLLLKKGYLKEEVKVRYEEEKRIWR
ncbi:MAG: hypothetical protein DRO65_00240 [Candidatus Altiarchaeales archaeon]|nr:MAG: hypothetical protein DRO65_00240 [Candidatus Altiarchaeales archaeon]